MARVSLTTRKRAYAAGLAVVVIVFAAAPLLLKALQSSRGVNLTRQDKALTGSQVMRGAYANTGSHDVGADPQWVGGRYLRSDSSPDTFTPSADELTAARKRLEAAKAAAGLR